jgi:hypothetical protein
MRADSVCRPLCRCLCQVTDFLCGDYTYTVKVSPLTTACVLATYDADGIRDARKNVTGYPITCSGGSNLFVKGGNLVDTIGCPVPSGISPYTISFPADGSTYVITIQPIWVQPTFTVTGTITPVGTGTTSSVTPKISPTYSFGGTIFNYTIERYFGDKQLQHSNVKCSGANCGGIATFSYSGPAVASQTNVVITTASPTQLSTASSTGSVQTLTYRVPMFGITWTYTVIWYDAMLTSLQIYAGSINFVCHPQSATAAYTVAGVTSTFTSPQTIVPTGTLPSPGAVAPYAFTAQMPFCWSTWALIAYGNAMPGSSTLNNGNYLNAGASEAVATSGTKSVDCAAAPPGTAKVRNYSTRAKHFA